MSFSNFIQFFSFLFFLFSFFRIHEENVKKFRERQNQIKINQKNEIRISKEISMERKPIVESVFWSLEPLSEENWYQTVRTLRQSIFLFL